MADLSTGSSVLCRVGSRLCAIPVEHVEETMRPLPIEPLSGMPPFLLGLSIIRGAATPVVNAGKLLGADETGPETRFVTLRVDGRRLALVVDAVIGVQAIAADTFQGLPPILHDAGADVVAAVGTLDSKLLLLLRSARMVPPSLWSMIDGALMGQ